MYLLFFIFSLTLPFTLAAPQSVSVPEPFPAPDPFPSNAGVQCDESPVTHRLTSSDCSAAIVQLPHDQPGDILWDKRSRRFIYPMFRRSNPDYPRHKIPQIRKAGYCAITINLKNGETEDENSWEVILAWLRSIERICVQTMRGLGGTATMGTHGKMIATMEFTLGEEWGSVNGTNGEETRVAALFAKPTETVQVISVD
ncbi:MAG: hypothetical protein Q9190_001604 [Brigantiaea leucoxantha]